MIRRRSSAGASAIGARDFHLDDGGFDRIMLCRFSDLKFLHSSLVGQYVIFLSSDSIMQTYSC